MKAVGGHPRVPPIQAGIAASHFAEVETEAQGGEMPSKAGSLGTGPMPELTLILPTLATIPSSSPFLSQGYGGACAKDRGLGILIFSGTRTLQPQGLGSNPISDT